jgi:hypothetical protein
MPMLVRTEPLPLPSHADATLLPNGNHQTLIPGGGSFEYSTSRSRGINGFSFMPGIYSGVSWSYRDAAGEIISGTQRIGVISPTDRAYGVGVVDAPSNAVDVAVEFAEVNGTIINYIYPLS